MSTTYEVRLESPTNAQHRIMSVGAESEAEARQIAIDKEFALCEFDLHPPARSVWEDPLGHSRDDAVVNLNLWDQHDPVFAAETATHANYGDAKRAASARLQNWLSRTEISKTGKIVGTTLGDRSKARLAAHLQVDPYEIVDVRAVKQAEIDANRLVREARSLSQNDPTKWAQVLQDLRDGGIPLNAVTAALFGVPTKNRSDGTSNGQIDWHSGSSDTFKVAAASNTYTPDLDAHDFFNDVTNEVTGTNWASGGITLGTLASSYDSSTDQARYDAADISVSTVTISGVRYFVGYKSTGTGSTSALIFLVNCGADVSATAGTLGVVWDATGAWLIDIT